MKKKNIISSLVIASILGSSLVSVDAASSNDTTKTEPLGIYTSLVEGKNIVPFILKSKTDRATIGGLKEKYPNVIIEGEANTVLKTGDKFKLNGVEHEVLVYGDVYPDGEIDIFDVMELIKVAKGHGTLSDIQKVAANVNTTDGEIDIFDAMNIVSVVKGNVSFDKITPVPKNTSKIEENNESNNINEDDKKSETKKEETQSSGGSSSNSNSNTQSSNTNRSTNKNYNSTVGSGTITTGTGNYSSKEIIDNSTIKIKYTANAVGYSYELKDKNDIIKNITSKDEVSNETVLHLAENLVANDEYTLTIKNKDDRIITTQKIKYEPIAVATTVTIANVLDKDANTTYGKILSSIANNVSLNVTLDKVIQNKNVKVILTEKDAAGNKVREVSNIVSNKTTSAITDIITISGFNVSNFSDGNIYVTVEVYDTNGNISRTQIVPVLVKDTREFKIVDTIAVSSTNTTDGSYDVSVNILTNDTAQAITKLYAIADISSYANKTTLVKSENLKTKQPDGTYKINISNPNSNSQYYVHIVAENVDGIQTDVVNEKIEKISTPQMAAINPLSIKITKFGNFEWTASNVTTRYEVILYANKGADKKVVATKNVDKTEVDFTSEIKKFAQDGKNSGYNKFTIGVISVAKTGYRNSDEQKSTDDNVCWNVVELVTPTITGIDFSNKEQKLKVTDNNITANKPLIDQFEVSIYKYDTNGNRATTASRSKKYITLDDISLTRDLFSGMAKGKYAVTIKAIANDFATSHAVNSAESSSENTYYVDVPSAFILKVIDPHTVNVGINEVSNVENADRGNFAYEVNYKLATDLGNNWTKVLLNNSLNLDITSLTADKEYEMFVSILYGTGATKYEIAQTNTLKITTEVAPLTFTNLVKVEEYPVNATQISCKGGKIIMHNGTNTYTPSTQVKNYNEVLKVLQAMPYSDKISSQGGKITVTKMISGGELSNALEDATLEVDGGITEVTFNASKIKKIILNDGVQVAQLSKVYNVTDGITLGANVSVIDVSNGTKLIMNGNTVIVNGVKIFATAGTELTVNSNDKFTVSDISNKKIQIISDKKVTLALGAYDGIEYTLVNTNGITVDNTNGSFNISGDGTVEFNTAHTGTFTDGSPATLKLKNDSSLQVTKTSGTAVVTLSGQRAKITLNNDTVTLVRQNS